MCRVLFLDSKIPENHEVQVFETPTKSEIFVKYENMKSEFLKFWGQKIQYTRMSSERTKQACTMILHELNLISYIYQWNSTSGPHMGRQATWHPTCVARSDQWAIYWMHWSSPTLFAFPNFLSHGFDLKWVSPAMVWKWVAPWSKRLKK